MTANCSFFPGQTLVQSLAQQLILFPLRFLRSAPRKTSLIGFMTILGCFLSAGSAQAALELRVAIEQEVSEVQLGTSTKAVVRDASGQAIAEIPAMSSVMAEADAGQVEIHQWESGLFWIEPTDGGYVSIGDKWYRGRTQVIAVAGGVTAVNYVDLEQYLYSVVGSEMPASWLPEALKAQAVAARTYALYKRQHNGNAVFDVGDTTTWQVYEGLRKETNTTQVAVNSTAGQVLTYNGQIIESVFHSSSGGYTENVEDVWSSPRPYLRAVQDFDQIAENPVYEWRQEFSADSFQQRITGVGRVLRISSVETTPRGRVESVRVEGDRGSRVLSGSEVRRALGLKSTLFSITPEMGRLASTGSSASVPVRFVVNGRGFGHGVGMSQWGAYGMAGQGYNYQQILGHYFQSSTLSIIQVN
ncbi:MAG: SpoIID/LytB domain-containing protein [Elainellaceae cyanobacterium]